MSLKGSVVNQVVYDDLLRAVADGVHTADPFHLVTGFEGFGHAFGGGQLTGQGGHLVPGRLIDVQQVPNEGAGEDQSGVGAVVLLLQVAFAHAAVLAEGAGRLVVQDQVGDQQSILFRVCQFHGCCLLPIWPLCVFGAPERP